MSSDPRGNSVVAGSDGLVRPSLAALLVFTMLVSTIQIIAVPSASDPWTNDDGDMTRHVRWNFTESADYVTYNATVSNGLGTLAPINSTVGEHTEAEYQLGTSANLDLQEVPDALVIDNTSLSVQTLVLQPGATGTGKDSYLDEWFPFWTPPDGGDLRINGQYDPLVTYNRRQSVVMQFNFSSVPAGSTIRDAKLWLYEIAGRPLTLPYAIHTLNSSWDDSAVSWMTRDLTHSWTNAGGDYSTESFGSGTIDGTNGWHVFDLSRLVDLWTRGKIVNNGLIMVAGTDPADTGKSFSDCEANKVVQTPQLVINYTLATVTGTYSSRPLGAGNNATFTLASWTNASHSKVTDEFSAGVLSSAWRWNLDPRLTGGSINFARPGWLNITGSQSTDLNNSNFLYQPVTGDFTFETCVQDYFTTATMGAGLQLRHSADTWLSIYKAGTAGTGRVVAEVSKGGIDTLLASIPWNSSTAILRMARNGASYSLSASMDGANWTTLAAYNPSFDFMRRIALGLCVFSNGPTRPVVEFDYARVEPLGQDLTVQLSVRVGNSPLLSDPSWTPWTLPLNPSSGTSLAINGKYLQYRAILATAYDWLSPKFSSFECHFVRYVINGTITTGEVAPPSLNLWEQLLADQVTTNGDISYLYSIDQGTTWVNLGIGSAFGLALANPSMMIRMMLSTHDTRSTPSIDSLELVYSITHAGFYVLAPSIIQAGQSFSVYVEPKDTSNNTASWTGAVSLNALDATGSLPASSELYVTNGGVPVGGHLTVTNERYDVAEAIRISVSGGGATGLSNLITVVPGPIDHITLDPDIASLPENNNTVFNATACDSLGNAIAGSLFSWHADASLGVLNATTGPSVTLTTATFVSGGYLNVTVQGLTLSRYISVAPSSLPPRIQPLPTQTKPEDFGWWTLDIAPYVSDREDSLSELRWYIVNETIVSVNGENRTGDMVITFSTLLNVFGTEVLELRVVDSDRMMSKASLTVEITPVNDPPRIDPITPLTVRHDDPYILNMQYYVHDPEASDEHLELSVDPASSIYVQVNELSLTFLYPMIMNGSTQTVLVTVFDGEFSASTPIIVTVSDDYVPRTIGTLPNLVMNQGDTRLSFFDLDDYFTDPDYDLLIYAYGNTHVNILIHANHTVDFYAPKTWQGQEYVVFRAVDPYGARAESAMLVTVLPVNQPPTIAGVPDLVVRFGQEYFFDLSPYVEDLDDDESALSVMPSDVHIWADGMILTLAYPAGMLGLKVSVNLTVSDGPLSDWWAINVTISSDNPPTLSGPAPEHSFLEDKPVSYPVAGFLEDYFTDIDGDPLTFVAFVSSHNVTAEAAPSDGKWIVVFQTEEHWNGITNLTLRAIDSYGAIAETTVLLTVVRVADPPLLELPEHFTVIEGSQAILDITRNITDPDSALSDFHFTVSTMYEDYVRISNGIVIFEFPVGYVPRGDASTDVLIKITVFDQDNLFSNDTILVTVHRQASAAQPGLNSLLIVGLVIAAGVGAGGFGFAVMRRRRPFVIRDMMLIHNDGFLIARHAVAAAGEVDEDILTGMLTAVLDFVEDSMPHTGDQLRTFGFQDYQVMVARGSKAFAAVVFAGDAPKNIDESLKQFLGKIEKIYRKKLVQWTGDIETDFAGSEVLLGTWITENGKKGKKKGNGSFGGSEKPPQEPAESEAE